MNHQHMQTVFAELVMEFCKHSQSKIDIFTRPINDLIIWSTDQAHSPDHPPEEYREEL